MAYAKLNIFYPKKRKKRSKATRTNFLIAQLVNVEEIFWEMNNSFVKRAKKNLINTFLTQLRGMKTLFLDPLKKSVDERNQIAML
jgi:hypothetical protein